MNADIRVYPDKEMKAVDMAVTLDALEVADGVIQGCEVTLSSGALNIASGRILIKGRLGVVTTGTIETPTLAASATCRLLAVCDLAIDTPFYIALFDADEYAAISERANSTTDFNGVNGVAFVQLGTADIDASTGTVTSWTANSEANAKRRIASLPGEIESVANRLGGTHLPVGTNIDNLTKEHSGWWVYARSDVSGTFPISDTYGTIGHIQGSSSNMAMQIIRSNTQARTNSHMFMRYKVDGTWGGWQRYISADSTDLTITNNANQYTTFDGVAFKKSGFLWLRGIVRLSHALPSNAGAQIATINGWNSPNSVYVTVANPNYGRETLYVTISYDGKVRIDNFTSSELTLGALLVFTTMAPASGGYE